MTNIEAAAAFAILKMLAAEDWPEWGFERAVSFIEAEAARRGVVEARRVVVVAAVLDALTG